jgi:hypothetical protein
MKRNANERRTPGVNRYARIGLISSVDFVIEIVRRHPHLSPFHAMLVKLLVLCLPICSRQRNDSCEREKEDGKRKRRDEGQEGCMERDREMDDGETEGGREMGGME